jgi:hypothetical protein
MLGSPASMTDEEAEEAEGQRPEGASLSIDLIPGKQTLAVAQAAVEEQGHAASTVAEGEEEKE